MVHRSTEKTQKLTTRIASIFFFDEKVRKLPQRQYLPRLYLVLPLMDIKSIAVVAL